MNLRNQRFGQEIYLRSGKVLGTPIPPFRYFFPRVNLPSNLKLSTFPAREDRCMIQMSGVCVTLRACVQYVPALISTRGIRGLIKATSWIRRGYG